MSNGQKVQNQWLQKCDASTDRKNRGKTGYGEERGRIRDLPVAPGALWVWMKDMEMWSTELKNDLLALEKHCEKTTGDPGDPPPPPEDDE